MSIKIIYKRFVGYNRENGTRWGTERNYGDQRFLLMYKRTMKGSYLCLLEIIDESFWGHRREIGTMFA